MDTKRDLTISDSRTHKRSAGAESKDPPRSAADFLPPRLSLSALHAAAADCKGCDLYKRATRTVFGEGSRLAAIMLTG